LPTTVDLWQAPTSEPRKTTVQFELGGRDVVMTTVFDARPRDEAPYVQGVRSVQAEGYDRQVLEVSRADGVDVLVVNETDEGWAWQGCVYPAGCSCEWACA